MLFYAIFFIYLMVKTEENKKEYDPVITSSGSPSEISFQSEEASATQSKQHSQIKTNIIKCSGALVILIVLAVMAQGRHSDRIGHSFEDIFNPQQVPFKFRVHCPVDYYQHTIEKIRVRYRQGEHQELWRRLQEFSAIPVWEDILERFRYGPYEFSEKTLNDPRFDPKKLYVVTISSIQDPDDGVSLRYCSLMREWNGSCADAKYYCVSPGAMFDFNVGEYQDVIWINQLNPNLMPDSGIGSCLTDSGSRCRVKGKSDFARTFHNPTELGNDQWQPQQIHPNHWPSVTHIHGLEVRPNFDGNPMAWISNNQVNQTAGIGFMNLENECYYKNFQTADNKDASYSPPNFYAFKEKRYNIVSKSNRYPNSQNPGNLWYHDHAMRLTQYNVQNGLSGVYIIRDPRVQEQLPQGKYQKFVMYEAKGMWEDQPDDHFEVNKYYRYRILNNNPEEGYVKFRFIDASKSCSTATDPSDALPFYMMGADSSIFHRPIKIEGKKNFIKLASAERIEILIRFTSSFKICADEIVAQHTKTRSKRLRKLRARRQFAYQVSEAGTLADGYPRDFDPETLDFSKYAPYVNLNESGHGVTVSKTRMRPMMMDYLTDPNDPLHYKLNGHFQFGRGESENPVIGTTEDWWLINLSEVEHPMHFHLINFQVVEYVSLRALMVTPPGQQTPLQCDLYNAEFNLEALKHHSAVGKEIFSKLNLYFNSMTSDIYNNRYQVFCYFLHGYLLNSTDQDLRGKTYMDFVLDFEEAAYNVNKETQFDSNNISGINLLKNNPGGTAYNLFISKSNCPQNYHNTLYYCQYKNDEIPPEYRRWKDTAMIPIHAAYKYRIRWAKSAYDYNNPEPNFFHVPVDQLREFPGFVYHCHVLDHEDNEMMRPIMLLPPQSANMSSDKFKCDQRNWNAKSDCLFDECRHDYQDASRGRQLVQG